MSKTIVEVAFDNIIDAVKNSQTVRSVDLISSCENTIELKFDKKLKQSKEDFQKEIKEMLLSNGFKDEVIVNSTDMSIVISSTFND